MLTHLQGAEENVKETPPQQQQQLSLNVSKKREKVLSWRQIILIKEE